MSCVAVELPSKRLWLVDCGAGTQQQMIKAGLWIGRVDKVFITHLHGDHCYDITGLLALRGMRQIRSPVDVYGPVGIRELIETTMRLSQLYLPFNVNIFELDAERIHDLGWHCQELPPTEPSDRVMEDDGEASSSAPPVEPEPSEPPQEPSKDWHIVAYPLDHRIACFGYVFTEKLQEGAFDASLAIAKGIKGKNIGKLASGEKILLEDGTTTVTRVECSRPPFPGRKLVILGDTHKCSADLHEGAKDADVFVHEATFEAGFEDSLALKSKHSTTTMAVDCALQSQAKTLIITHFSARYTDHSGPKYVSDLISEAKQRASGTNLNVHAAKDFWSFEIPPKKASLASI